MKKSGKKRGRWDNLKKNKNLKLRQDYINTHYLNGMKSITGKGQGLRKLTDEEKDWLNTFYGEYVNASMSNPELLETPDENIEKIAELQEKYDELSDKIAKLDLVKDMEERNILAREMVDLKSEMVELDYTKDSYNRNNARNRCLLNKGKATNTVEFRSWEQMDQNTIEQLDGHDLELVNAYYAGLLDRDED